MYQKFFGLSAPPFPKALPPSSIFLPRGQEEALARILFAAQNKMFATLIGGCGCGKTTILRELRASLNDDEHCFLYLADSNLTPRHFYNGLLAQLGSDGAFYRGDSRRKLHHEIELLHGVQHRSLVVVVDEAHLLDKEMLEELRFLLNFKMDSENPLALVLSGQPELEEKLGRRSSVAIMQRIDLQCKLSPLSLAETGDYIRHHLLQAGTDKPIFTESAVKTIFAFSAGSARLINKACVNAMMYGTVNNIEVLDDDIVASAIENELRFKISR